MRFAFFVYRSLSLCRTLLVFLLGILFLPANAQLHADFTPEKNGGCSPLSISFTNTTTGASDKAVYYWDFDNGNSSVFKNAGALFTEEKVYTVTLTVKEDGQTSVQSKTITVYKKPGINFTASPAKGCLSLPVTFNSTSTPGDGAISSYHWDFGDGSIQQSSGPSVLHAYTFEQTAGVSLTAVNTYGCTGTLTKAGLVTVRPALEAGFTADKTIACTAPSTVIFTNNSTGPGTLSYQWDFGDGSQSADMNPTHAYTRRGTYTVKLTVISSEGCVKEFVRNAYINIADFTTNFQAPALICTDAPALFMNTSQPQPSQSTWTIDGLDTYTSYGNNYITHNFVTAGMHIVKLINNFGICQQSITRQVEIKKSPVLNGFLAEIAGQCGAPVTVNFKDTTSDAVSWQWNFNWWYTGEVHSTIQAPSNQYTADNIYNVMLRIANAAGCTASVTEQVGISRPLVGIFLDPNSREEGCGPWEVKFNYRSTEPLTSYTWSFGDGATSTLAEPVHIFKNPGSYLVTFSYTTVNGCTGTASYYRNITVRQKPEADFTIQPAVCGNTPVYPINNTTGYAYNYFWDFGDGGFLSAAIPMHQYQQEGIYSITLIANNGMCNDTITKTNVIKVSPPFARIGGAGNTCDGTRGEVTFTDDSRSVNSWSWNFGDGSPVLSYTTAQAVIKHTYTKSGSYKVVLTTTNGACTVKDSISVYVLLKQKPVLSFDRTENCVNAPVNYHITGLEPNPVPSPYPIRYSMVKMEYSDGTALAGYFNVNNYWQTDAYGTLASYEVKEDRLRATIVSEYFRCEDTTSYVPIAFSGSHAGFEVVSDDVCYKSPVILKDTSKSSPGNPIVSWQWNFGDGQVQTFSQGGSVSHVYANPGAYYATLKVTDRAGCVSNNSTSAYVETTGPKAAFGISPGPVVQLNTPVTFYNYTNAYNAPGVAYSWDLGNGVTSAAYSPSYTFTEPGEYVITLVATNTQIPCSDTVRQSLTVRDFNTGFTSSTSFIGNHGQCPPVLARFVNTSSNYTRIVWDFGDGFILQNQNYPNHIYNTPGIYVVTLYVYGYNGLTGTFKDTVRVNTPQASIQASDLEGCIGHNVMLHAPTHAGAAAYLWDFGNGQLVNAMDSFALHQYQAAGVYTPSLIVKDVAGCAIATMLADKIVVHPDPVISVSPAMPVVCKGVAIPLNASGAQTYQWSPADGLNDPAAASPLALPAETTTYLLAATDMHGCKGTGSVMVTVAKPFALQAPASFNVCKDSSIQLNAAGAYTYQWIGNTLGLSNPQIANPVATPGSSTVYRLTGFDQYQCYSDTADISVFVRPHPFVDAGSDREVVYGSENRLLISNSNDVVRWNWSPTDFLSCAQCPSPISKPYSSVDYIVTVANSFNCAAKDTVRIKAFCQDGNIHIPTAFTPNHDGRNDVFTIYGSGVSVIRSLRVYNRWGEPVFVKKDFYPNDNGLAWNGIYKGVEAPAGTYVYFAEMECGTGERFERKGTVTLVR